MSDLTALARAMGPLRYVKAHIAHEVTTEHRYYGPTVSLVIELGADGANLAEARAFAAALCKLVEQEEATNASR